jgi:pimeloyl-ACP methyl ester carboxylesterase
MSSPENVKPQAPEWFRHAVATPEDSHFIEVRGCRIHYLSWGAPGRPGLVLVHGGAAHARWWSFIAPFLAGDYHVVALDMSGHGDSGRREEYPRELWAEEIVAVAGDAGFPGPPMVIGHSLGGLVTIATASLFGDRLAGAIAIDSPVRRPDPESVEGARGRAFRNPKTYPDLETAMAHFFLIPPQPCENPYIVEHVARHSLKEVEGGWTWKFDARVFERFSPKAMNDYLASTRCRVALVRGAKSDLVTPEISAYMYELLDRNAPVVEIPEAHHHVPLDQPLALVAALRALIEDWEHSVPKGRT